MFNITTGHNGLCLNVENYWGGIAAAFDTIDAAIEHIKGFSGVNAVDVEIEDGEATVAAFTGSDIKIYGVVAA